MRSGDAPPDARVPFDPPEAPVLRCPACGAAVAAGEEGCAHCGAPLATRRCLACFRLGPASADRCARCGALLPADALAATPAGPCPDCRLPMAARSFGAVGYSECPRCGGLFLAPAAFGAVSKDAGTRAAVRLEKPPLLRPAGAPLPPVKYRRCPACATLMTRENFAGGSGILVDRCGRDGVFFDRGELTAIVDFIEGGGLERARRRERERLAEEVRSLEARRGRLEGGATSALPPWPTGGLEGGGAGPGALSTAFDLLRHLFRP